jgi:hypothetical protein
MITASKFRSLPCHRETLCAKTAPNADSRPGHPNIFFQRASMISGQTPVFIPLSAN